MIPVQASGIFWQQTALCCATTWDPGAQLLWLLAALLHALLASLHMYWRPRRRCAVLGLIGSFLVRQQLRYGQVQQ